MSPLTLGPPPPMSQPSLESIAYSPNEEFLTGKLLRALARVMVWRLERTIPCEAEAPFIRIDVFETLADGSRVQCPSQEES